MLIDNEGKEEPKTSQPEDIIEPVDEFAEARKIGEQVRAKIIATAEALQRRVVEKKQVLAEPLDQKKIYTIWQHFDEPLSIADLRKQLPDLADMLQQPVIDDDTMAKSVTDQSTIEAIRIINNPAGVNYTGIALRLSLSGKKGDSEYEHGQEFTVGTHQGGMAYITRESAMPSLRDREPGFSNNNGLSDETRVNYNKIDQAATGIQRLSGLPLNTTVRVSQG